MCCNSFFNPYLLRFTWSTSYPKLSLPKQMKKCLSACCYREDNPMLGDIKRRPRKGPMFWWVLILKLKYLTLSHILCVHLRPWSHFVTVVQGLFVKGKNTLDVRSLQQRKVSSVPDYLWFGFPEHLLYSDTQADPTMHCRYGP